MLEIRVLGPVEVYHQNTSVHFARRQQRLILGILALEANREVSCDRLIDLLWEDAAPRNARAVVQSRLSEVRAALSQYELGDTTQLISRGNSYLLQIPSDQVDAHRFRKIAAEARRTGSDEQARIALRDALGLWRGPVLGTRPADDAIGALCQNLEAARLTAWEDLFELELLLGRHYETVDEVVEMAARNRTRERLMEHMMLALHRTGRSTEALQAYDRWRRWLSDELGADPGGQLQRIHVSILDNDPSLLVGTPARQPRFAAGATGFAAAVPRTLPPVIVDFTGRGAEVGLLRQALSSNNADERKSIAISGPAGVGKTALAIQVSHLLRDEFPDGQLYANLHGTDFDEPVKPIEVLGRFLRAFGVDGPALPTSLDERADLYRDLVAERGILVVLDNAASDDQILPLIPAGPRCAVIITARARLGVTLGAAALGLQSLEPERAQDLLSCIVGATRIAAEPEATARLARLCGYLPLAIRVVGARLAAKPHWSVEKIAKLCADEKSRLDQLAYHHLDVRSSIGLSFAGLPDRAQVLLRLLGDIDLPDITVWVATALLDIDVPSAESALESLFDAHLVDVTGRDAAGYPRYRMHDLVRLFAKERAIADHQPADLDIARERAFRCCLTLAERQHIALYGDGGHYIKGSSPRWSPDERLAAELLAQPMRWFDQERQTIVAMIHRTARDHLALLCWELASVVAPLLQMRRDFDGLQTILNTALHTAETAGDQYGRAAMLCRIGLNHVDRSEPQQALELLSEASAIFQSATDPRPYGTTVSLLATINRFIGEGETAFAQYQEALEILEHAGDEVGVAWVLRGIGQSYMDAKEYDRASGYLERSLQKYRAIGASQGEATSLFWLGMLHLNKEQPAEALNHFEQALAIARSMTDRPGEAQCLRGVGLAYQALGQADLAKATLLEALELVRQPRPTLLEGHIQLALAGL